MSARARKRNKDFDFEKTMEDDGRDAHQLDLENADRHVWLMKSPVVVSKTWDKLTTPPPSSFSSYSSPGLASLAKVVESVNPLQPEPEVLAYNLQFRFSKLSTFIVSNKP